MELNIQNCPGTLASNNNSYSHTCLRRLFNGRKVSHILPYDSPVGSTDIDQIFIDNRNRISISGVQEKFSLILIKNKLRLIGEGERGTYILKPIPNGHHKRLEEMPANEHLTMQMARQVYGIETAENGIIFFKNGHKAYITKRFDYKNDKKLATEDFAALANRTPQTHGKDYKYKGCYSDFFDLMKRLMPAYKIEAPKMFRLLVFNYLFSNGDAHFKNFSFLETSWGDHRLSPAYDLLNTRIHVEDSDFALENGLLPKSHIKRKIKQQFYDLGQYAGLSEKEITEILLHFSTKCNTVEKLIKCSFLTEKVQRSYWQYYQARVKKITP